MAVATSDIHVYTKHVFITNKDVCLHILELGGGGGVIITTSNKVNHVFIPVEKDSTYVRCQAQLNCPHQVAVPVQCRPLCH